MGPREAKTAGPPEHPDVLRQRAPIRFSLVAVNVDSGYKEHKHDSSPDLRGLGLYTHEHIDGELIEDILDADQTPFALRLRRGVRTALH